MTIAKKHAQQYMPNGEVSLEQVIQAAIDEAVAAYVNYPEYRDKNELQERIRQLEQERDSMALVPRELLDKFPELNTSNYGHDDVGELNAWGIELVLAAAPTQEKA